MYVLRLCGLIALGFLSGCSHYQLGTGAAPAFHSIYVEPVANRTTLPQAREIVTTQIRETFARDGRVSLVNSPESADATLTVVLVDYHRDVAAVREGDTGLARKFNLVLGVDCTLRQRDGTVLFQNRRITARREAFTDSGQLQAEYDTVPLLAEDLARQIAHAALDVW
ncbi:MAG TPA: LPS assembly lipoprotein LptE [Opitutaceae bacterium]|nr:LPS assembly lipoprotein LptE [Opitutaceae bacterium]